MLTESNQGETDHKITKPTGQVLHVDYEDTLSPFARFTLIHLIIAIVVHMD